MAELKTEKTSLKSWNIKLRVNSEEESIIKKEAIDYQMGLAEFIKHKLLDRLSVDKKHNQGKSA